MSQPPHFRQLLGIALLAGAVAVAAPVAAQSVQDLATASCLSAVKARSGGVARVFKVSGQSMPIVELTAPGNVSYTCFTNGRRQGPAAEQGQELVHVTGPAGPASAVTGRQRLKPSGAESMLQPQPPRAEVTQ